MNEVSHPGFEKPEEYETFTTTNGLEEAARKYGFEEYLKRCNGGEYGTSEDAFIAGAKWHAEHTPLPEDTVLFNKGVAEGRRLAEEELSDLLTIAHLQGANQMKKLMLMEAVEADVMLTLHDKTGDVSLHTGYLPKELGIKCGDKVRIIIIKDDGKSD